MLLYKGYNFYLAGPLQACQVIDSSLLEFFSVKSAPQTVPFDHRKRTKKPQKIPLLNE